jgi:hypothetical protein
MISSAQMLGVAGPAGAGGLTMYCPEEYENVCTSAAAIQNTPPKMIAQRRPNVSHTN